MTTYTRLLMRRKTAAQWNALNEILMDGELGIVTDSTPRVFKIGDGLTQWNNLPFAIGAIPAGSYAGPAFPNTVPATPAGSVFYSVSTPGTYTGFGNLDLPANSQGFIGRDATNTSWLIQYFTNDFSLYAKTSDVYSILAPVKNVLPIVKTLRTPPVAQNGFYSSANGTYTANTQYWAYLLPVETYGTDIYITGGTRETGNALAVYFNGAGAFISSQFVGVASVTTNYLDQKLTIPSGTVSIGISIYTATLAVFKIKTSALSTDILTKTIGDLSYPTKSEFNTLKTSLPQKKTVEVTPTLTTGYFNPTNGIAINNAPYQRCIIVLADYTGKNIYITGTTRDPGMALIVYFDANGVFISFEFRGTATSVNYVSQIINPPINAITAGICSYTGILGIETGVVATDLINKSTGDLIYGSLSLRRQVKLQLTASSKVILYGDSISSTDYTWYKDAMQALTGATVYNGGFSGFTAAQLAQNTQLQRIFDYNSNLIICMVGGNDSGIPGSVGTFGASSSEPLVTETDISVGYNGTYFIQAVSHTIRKLLAQYYNIRARAALTGSETEAEKTAKIDAVVKPYIVFVTPLPQKRTNADHPFSQPDNWQRKRDAVVECCNKYSIHCIDLMNMCGYDMSVEPYYSSPTNTTTNNGVYFMDGLHPNKWGAQHNARIVCGELGII